MIGPAPLCVECKHLHTKFGRMACDAYPDGIPDAILEGEVDHHKPYEGDHGVQFEQVEK